jgi:hypothetical protein
MPAPTEPAASAYAAALVEAKSVDNYSTVPAVTVCPMTEAPDHQMERDALLRLHANAREAQFANSAELLLSDDADPLIDVRAGEIQRPIRAERTAFFRRCLDGASYQE